MKISVIGLGYVGLPLSVLLARNYEVIGFETDRDKVNFINSGKSPIEETGLEEILLEALNSGRFMATSEEHDILDTTVKIITVGTPYDPDSDSIDYGQLVSALEIVTRNLHKGDMIILKSTVPPGTTMKVIKGYVEKAGLQVPKHIGLVFSPERIVEGQAISDFQSLPKIIGATEDASYLKTKDILSSLGGTVVRVSSPDAAEMVKMVDNYTRFVELGLTNEIALMSENAGIDVMEILAAAKQEYPRNSGLLIPGPGVGGSCLNKDPFILRSFMSTRNMHLKMVESAKQVNYSMPHHIVELAESYGHTKKIVLIAGVAFKGETDDTRYSPAFQIGDELAKEGHFIRYTDPYVKNLSAELFHDLYEAASGASIVIFTSDHNEYRQVDLEKLKQAMDKDPLIIDTRAVLDRKAAKEHGFEYHGLGRL